MGEVSCVAKSLLILPIAPFGIEIIISINLARSIDGYQLHLLELKSVSALDLPS